MNNRASILIIVSIVLVGIMAGCSTKENTARSRFWHAFNAKYNTYYNGAQAYIEGSLEKETGNKDNYTEMIPLYTVGNKTSRELGKSNFDIAIKKSQKAIDLHSIKRRPVWNKDRRKTPRDVEWLNRKEYNPFIWKAWMLMGRSQFHQGEFDEATSTFAYMSRLFATQPAIYGKAQAWLAKCYIEAGWNYDAEDVIRNMQRDSIDWRARKEWDYTLADYYLHTGDMANAATYLRKVIRHEMRRKQRAREWYLLGQVQAAQGRNAEAYDAFRHVVRLNPPYELAFNARISMTEVLSHGQEGKMIKRLRRMAASDNNKDYLDQIYYAIGNIYMAQNDTLKAISAYEKGNEKSTRSGVEKGVLLLRLGDIYWEREDYSNAKRCYTDALGMLDSDRKDYQQLSDRSRVLDKLVPYTEEIHLQDSLQVLAKMDEKDRNAAIDRVIAALKKKEKEERDREAEQNGGMADGNMGFDNQRNNNRNNTQNTPQGQQGNKKTEWYFYNQLVVSQGKTAFQRQWGNRKNIDDWQRSNHSVVAQEPLPANGSLADGSQTADSLANSAGQTAANGPGEINDSLKSDPHSREYYLAQIPFTEDQLKESNTKLEDGLYNAGVIFKDDLGNLPLSEKHLRRLTDNYPDYEHMDDAYYHLFLLYMRQGDRAKAQQYVALLAKDYPESQWTALLTDPHYEENARFGEQIEDSLYAASYEAFKAGRYDEVLANEQISTDRFPEGANRDKFLFVGGMSKLNAGDVEGCLEDMNAVVKDYPDSRLAQIAGSIINGVNDGRRLYGGLFDLTSVWSQRSATLSGKEEALAKGFSAERDVPFSFVIVYAPDSTNENQLLFELAKFNFTTYLVRNFDINIENLNGLHRMIVNGFRSYDEVMEYARAFYQQMGIQRQLAKARTFIISDANLELLGTTFSYDDYASFYLSHFGKPIAGPLRGLLLEPDDLGPVPEPESQSSDQPSATEESNTEEEGDIIIPQEKPATPQTPEEGDVIIPQEKPATQQNTEEGEIIIPQEKPAENKQSDEGEIIIPQEKPLEPETPRNDRTPTTPKNDKTPTTPKNPTPPAKQPAKPQQPAKKQESAKKPQPAKPQQKPQPAKPKPQQKPKPAKPKPQPSKPKPQPKKNETFDPEDEYYDLGGF